MRVYYDPSFWGKGKGLWGTRQLTDWQFEHAGTKRYIPAIYRFARGVVFDVITILDETKLRAFIEEYEAREETLTPLERRLAEQKHPYQAVPIKEIWINGKRVEGGYSASSAVCIPWLEQGEELVFVREAYLSILHDATCFGCERFSVPYPEADSKVQELLRYLRLDKVQSMKLITYPVSKFLPLDIRFEMAAAENQKQLCFSHPVTGVKHTLYFQGLGAMELPSDTRAGSLYVSHARYEIEPSLPTGDTLQFDSTIQHRWQPDCEFAPQSAGAIGIIGGADGPTAIFGTREGAQAPTGSHGLPLHSCLSVPSLQKESILRFVIAGINSGHLDSKEYSFR